MRPPCAPCDDALLMKRSTRTTEDTRQARGNGRPLLLLVLLAATGFLAIFDNVITLSTLPFLRNPAAVIAATLVGLYVWYRRNGLPLLGGTYVWVLSFLAYTATLEILRGIWTGDPEFLRYAQWGQILVLTAISIDLARDRRTFGLAWGGIVAATAFMAIASILALPGFTQVIDGRVGFIEVNLNRQGYWYALAATTILWWVLARWPRIGWRGIASMGLLVTLVFALIQTGSRGALLSMAVGSTIVLVVSLRARNLSAYATVVPVILLLGAWYMADEAILRERLSATLSGEDFGSRDTLAVQAFELLVQRPWFGYGPGFVEELGEVRGIDRAISSHNSFMQVALSFGLPGLTLWLGIMISAWSRSLRSWFRMREPIAALLLALMSMSLAFALVSDLAFNKYFWTLVALASQAPLPRNWTAHARHPSRIQEAGSSKWALVDVDSAGATSERKG